MSKITRALVSVSDKSVIVDFCQSLVDLGIEIISTGSTAKLLNQHHLDVLEVADYTGFPEILGGRVKTLHPRIHAGILARRGEDDFVMQKHDINNIDLVVVNLYPFTQVTLAPDCPLATAIENIDIGGVTLLRSAAKNQAYVTVLVDTSDYAPILTELKENNCFISDTTRFSLAKKAFEHTANYDAAIANFMQRHVPMKDDDYPPFYMTQLKKHQTLRYGENPHQTAALYTQPSSPMDGTLAGATQVQGKALSYNNFVDANAALECVLSMQSSACAIIKHANPCGVALGDTLLEAYNCAYETDPSSAFGGVIAFNEELDEETITAILERQFVEVIIAPTATQAAQEAIKVKPNVRMLIVGQRASMSTTHQLKSISGGILIQDNDQILTHRDNLQMVTKRQPTEAELDDLIFAMRVAKHVKSNAIVYAKNKQTLGIGVGQTSRVYSARIAALKAQDQGLNITDSVMASDAFFPFRDSIDTAAKSGIIAVIQPGGSMRDPEVIAAADEHNIAMVFTGKRHFLH